MTNEPFDPTEYLIWRVADGPYSYEDLPEEDQPEDPSLQCFLVLMMTPKGNHKDYIYYELWFDSFDGAYRFKNKVDTCMEPVMIGDLVDA